MNAPGTPNRPTPPVSRATGTVAALGLLLAGCGPSGERALVEGDRLLQAGKAAEAIPMLEKAAQDLPQNGPALNHLGLAYHATGRTNDARRAYLRALEVDRNRIEATHNLAVTHLERGEWLEAEKGLRAYLLAHPGDPVVLETLSQLQFRAGRWDDAERSLAAIQPPQALGADGWNTRGVLLLRKRRFNDAVKCFQYALSLDPAFTTPRFNLGVTHQLQGDRRSAAAQYRQWLAANPAAPQGTLLQEWIRQWEAPQTTTGTNPGTAAGTNAIVANPPPPQKAVRPPAPAPRTNAVAEVARPVAPAPAAPVTPPVVTAPPPQIAPPPPVQVVNVQEDPPLRPAQDDLPARPAPTVSAPPPAPATTPAKPVKPAEPQVTAVTPSPASSQAAPGTDQPSDANEGNEANAPAKRSLWQRVTPGKWANPVQWFRKSADTNAPPAAPAKPPAPAPKKKPTPLPPLATTGTTQPPTVPAVAANRPPVHTEIATPRRPAPPRYVRKAVGPLPAGNRSVAEGHFQQGASAHQRRDLVTAAAEYRRATEADPAFHEAYHNLALVAMDQGDLSLALLACEHAILLKPSDPETRRNFASALKAARYPQDAVEQIELYLAAKPTDTASHLAAASLYAGELDDPAKARTHYESVLALEPSHPQAAAIRGWLAAHPR